MFFLNRLRIEPVLLVEFCFWYYILVSNKIIKYNFAINSLGIFSGHDNYHDMKWDAFMVVGITINYELKHLIYKINYLLIGILNMTHGLIILCFCHLMFDFLVLLQINYIK